MSLPPSFYDFFEDRLNLAVHDINAEDRMKYRITEDTFFQGQQRHPGDILDYPTGPYKYAPGTGKRTAQFVEIDQPTQSAPMTPVQPSLPAPMTVVGPSIPTPLPSVSPVNLSKTETKPMTTLSDRAVSIKSKIAAAKSAMENRIALTDQRTDAAIAAASSKVESALTAVESATEKAVAGSVSEAEAMLNELAEFTNGGPA